MNQTTKRCNDWPRALALFLEEKRNEPFAWGVNDCCTFVCDWLAILTGVDPAADFRGKYSDALGAKRVLKKRGGLEAIALRAAKRWGWAPVPVREAQRGDLVLCEMPEGLAAGVCFGAVAAFAGAVGVVTQPMTKCRRAWRVG
jgi:hypothetical protein